MMTLRTALLVPLVVAAAAGCKHTPSEKERQTAQIHYDLGVQAQQADPQAAFREYEMAIKLDPQFAEAHNAMGIVLHLSFLRLDEAIEAYKKALEVRPTFSEAKTNLANVYLDQQRYDEAIALYQSALNDMLYPTPFIAHGNLGWAMYKKGETGKAIDHIKAAVTTNPKFCLGFKNLGIIYDEQGSTAEACKYFGKYKDGCPEVADAYYRQGLCQMKLGQRVAAQQSFDGCLAKAQGETLKDDCQRLKEQASE